MKKLLSICLGLIILLAACGSDSKSDEKSKENNTSNSQQEKKNNSESNSKVSSIDKELEKELQENENKVDSPSEDDEDEEFNKFEYDLNYVVSKKEEEQLEKLLYKDTNAYGKITDIDHIWQYGQEDRHDQTFTIDGQSIIYDGKNKDLYKDKESEMYQVKKIDDHSVEGVIAKTPESKLHEVSNPVLKNSKLIITYIDDNTIKIKKDDYPEETLHASINNDGE
ncbi:hypothetical protein [Mammaliicoccus sciuri]|uniref:hypothetical protein n=1 Tax=Mammaliicoccus sciuri TaxID=1296 RepID=UPI0018B05F28|nr:hypothetical protein [Mammaliicoccus sciuri]MBF9297427.1 hypothetical protein [Staphylococcus schleiferi]MCJ0943158.1 hypothetical protein [Mammaliicoccus sciuri]MDO0949412.1 hypothetical protein [Mammaliicoccus sciuri]MDO0954947.1 hypothetical protein [Mammaliicoccus sciuri]